MYKTLSTIFFIIAVSFFIYQSTIHKTSPNGSNSYKTPNVSQNSGSSVAENPSSQCHMKGELPDSICTPGVINPDVTQSDINQTICVSGYTKTIRPAASYTDNLKQQQMQQYGFTDSIRLHEEDHLISLELGGSPSDPKNLWPEPHASPNPKDKIENFLHAAVCSGRISLSEAQQRISQNWVSAEHAIQ